jgi:two-component system sensor histidine kinase EvgS
MVFRRLSVLVLWLVATVASVATGHTSVQPSKYPPGRPLRVVMDNNYPPYVFTDASGSARGILIDRWRLWEEKTGRRAELHLMDWGEAMRRMEAGEFDVIDTIFYNEERARIYDFSKPYANLEVPVFFHRNISGITDAGSLKGFAVGVKKGDAAIDFLKSRGVEQLLLFDSYAQIVGAARDGKVVVFVIDKPPALYFLYKLGIQDRFRFSEPLYVGQFHRAVRKGDAALLETVEEGFSRITPREFERIDNVWHGSAPLLATPYLRYLLAAVLAVSVIALGLVGWNRTLRKSVEQRTKALREEMELNKRHVEALSRSESRFRTLAAKTPVPFAISKPRGAIEFLNERFVSTYGYDTGDLPDIESWWPLAYPDERERREAMETWAREEELAGDNGEIRPHEYRVTCKNGTVRTAEIFGAGIGDQLLVVFNDVTERKALEQQLLQSRKMEAVGRLAGGIAHDFNNLLTVIIGYLSLIQSRTGPGFSQSAELVEVKNAAEKAAELTRQLLAFSRRQVLDPKIFDLNDTVRNAERILERLLGEDISFDLRLHDRPLPVLADPGQIEQIVMNLAVNARDAMPDGGTLTITSRREELGEDFTREHTPLLPGAHAVLSVSDTGIGMNAETLSRIFEPFFTTKDVGKGTGLGLSTVYGIVAQSKGCITVESMPGRGSTFRIYLPSVASALPCESPAPAAKPALGHETILVAEDEASVRELICSLLQEEGYRVLSAVDGQEAFELSLVDGPTVDLLLTDVIMPRMNGRELADRLSARMPGLSVLFMSGYTDDAIGHHGVMDEEIPFLPKPFSPDKLLRKIREVLESGQRPADPAK